MADPRLPSYVTENQPNPMANRAPWYKNTAPTYAGIMLWFVFWNDVPSNGALSAGLGMALLSLVVSALICHFLFYLVPGLLGMKTGRPLYIVGTSTYGAQGGFIMPGFLMGVLQFGWLGVNTYFSSIALSALFGSDPTAAKVIMVLWAVLAAFVGLKGIQYVAGVATYLPLIPLAILLFLLTKTIGNAGSFDAADFAAKSEAAGGAGAIGAFGVFALSITYVVGFFATAGAAGVDFGMNNKDEKNVQMGGLIGIALATIIAGGISLVVAAGAFAKTGVPLTQTALEPFLKNLLPVEGDPAATSGTVKTFLILLAVAAFPPACFSSFIAANSFKTTLPKTSPFITVGIGTLVSIILAVTGWAGEVISVFKVIGASFGPICGAMMVDYLMSGKKWVGPRAGFNPAGWISWAAGFVVGMIDTLGWVAVPASPLVAFVIGAVLYFALAKAGMESEVVPLDDPSPEAGDAEGATA